MGRKQSTGNGSPDNAVTPPPEWPADQVERWPIERLIAYTNNPRLHPEAQIVSIQRSIETFGWTVPVLVDEDGTLIAGHGRVEAARRLGLARIPVMVARGWPESKKRAYLIADNQLALTGEWDESLLRVEIQQLKAAGDFDLTLLGFPELQLVDFVSGLPGGEQAAEKAEPERELTEAEQKLFDQAWRKLAREWGEIVAAAPERGYASTNYTRGALAVAFMRARLFGDEVPRMATLPYTLHRLRQIGHWRGQQEGETREFYKLFDKAQTNDSVLRGLVFVSKGKLDAAIGSLAVHNYHMPADFPVPLALSLINEFCRKGGAVLDPCHGWGGRLIGFLLSHAGSYEGFDVDPDTHKGVQQVANDLAPYAEGKHTVRLHLTPFEDSKLKPAEFDFALTSPPYFNTEQYGGDLTSWKRYPDFEKWVAGFYHPLLDKTARALKPGGIFCLQVGSMQHPLEARAREIAPRVGFDVLEVRQTEIVNNQAPHQEGKGEVVVVLRRRDGKAKPAPAKKANGASDPAAKYGKVL